MSGAIAPVLDDNNPQRASLNARLVVLSETIAQLRGAELVYPKGGWRHKTGERMEPATPSVAWLPDSAGWTAGTEVTCPRCRQTARITAPISWSC